METRDERNSHLMERSLRMATPAREDARPFRKVTGYLIRFLLD
jgi:hypothetical protein